MVNQTSTTSPRSSRVHAFHAKVLGITLLALGAVLLFTRTAGAQCTGVWSCASRDVTTPPPQGLVSVPTGQCKEGNGAVTSDTTLPDGGYAKGVIQLDAAGALTGYCDRYIFGSYYDTQRRNVNAVTVDTASPPNYGTWDYPINPPTPGPVDHATIYNYVSAQSIDSRVPSSTSGPDHQAMLYTGEYAFGFTLWGMSTDCLIEPQQSSPSVRKIMGVECLPSWVKDALGNPLLPKFPLTQEGIKLVFPASLSNTVNNAVTSWDTTLARWGLVSLNFVPVADGSCLASDSHCVRIDEGLLNCDDPTACGCNSYGGPLVDGVYQSRSTISLKPGLTNADFKTWVIGHELGHLLGLLDAKTTDQSCADQASVMRTVACNSQPPTGAGRATDNDGLPVARTVYNGGPTKTCGWY